MSLSQEIESKIAILDIVNRYVQTKKAGANFKALCPFHSERTPSFIISPAKNIAKCFSCGKGGGPINFLKDIENIDYREAIKILAKEAGIELKTSLSQDANEKGKDIYLLYKLTTEWYHKQIFLPEGKVALNYLLSRGLSEETIKKFSLGYSSSPRDLLYFLKSQGFELKFLIESGIFVSEFRDKFFGRVIFPITNYMGAPVAFTGRILQNGEPKYLNSPTSRIFDKSSILYGMHLAKQIISKTGEVFIVEGQMDTISLHQAHIDNVVGISGTALTSEHIRILKRFAKIIYLALDADSAGIKATFLSIENLLNSDLEIRIILIPNGKDPDEFIKSGGDFSTLKQSALSVIDYYILMGKNQYNLDTLVGKKQLIEKCLELVVKISSPIEVDFYLKHLADSFDISKDAIYETFYSIKRGKQKKNVNLNAQEDNVKAPFIPNNFDLLAAYIEKFGFLDLFFQKFSYNTGDLISLPGAGLLYSLLSGKNLDTEEQETLSVLDIYIDETIPDKHPEIISRQFLDLLRQLHIALLDVEKKHRLKNIAPDNPEYLLIYTELLQKAKQLGIPQGSISL